jgi:glycosyltransferase involved in cell wall biosynthesis
MRQSQTIGVVIPALDEADAIGRVVGDIPAWVDKIVVADNGSRDGTGDIARRAGAIVVRELEPGYGAACLAGIKELGRIDVIVFLDGDYSDYPEDMADLVDPILSGNHDFVIGSRATGAREAGSLTPQQRFGNWLATTLIRQIWGAIYTDLGPFRAIRTVSLATLGMADRNFGWTVEMQIKAAEHKLRSHEVPVRYRCRIGVSKVSGTVKGSVKAACKILSIIGRHALRRYSRPVAAN